MQIHAFIICLVLCVKFRATDFRATYFRATRRVGAGVGRVRVGLGMLQKEVSEKREIRTNPNIKAGLTFNEHTFEQRNLLQIEL